MLDHNEHIGRRMRQRRRYLGLTQADVAKACGTSLEQVQTYECGAADVDAAFLWPLAQTLRVPVGYFYEGLEHRPLALASAAEVAPVA